MGACSCALAVLARGAETTASPLLQAVRSGDTAGWQALLKNKADVAARDAAGNTALHLAALNHDVAAVNALLAAGAEVDAKNKEEATPLLYGAGHAQIVRALLAKKADVNATSKMKNTPLLVAVGHADSLEAARLLLDAGADLHVKRTTDFDIVLPRAVIAGNRQTIDLLIARGAAQDKKAVSMALRSAAFGGEKALVELLLAHGGDPNISDEFSGHTLNLALLGEELEIARLLIEKGANPSMRSLAGHGTPTMVFAGYNQAGDASVAKALVARGVDINAANDHGATVLSYALRSGARTPLVEYLQGVGAKAPETTRAKRVPDRAVPASPEARVGLVRERLPATLKLLQTSSDAFLDNGFVQKSNCTSCHGQDLPAVAYDLARARGFAIDENSWGRHLALQTTRWTERAEWARQMRQPVEGAPITVAYGLFAMRSARYLPNDVTDAMVRYLIRTQRGDGAWTDPIRRPPMEDGTFVATGWVALAARDFAPLALKAAAAESQARSARWLAAQKPSSHNEAVFQLLGLHWSSVPRAKLAEYVARLSAAQRPDGGWAQLAGIESDSWATGSALYALHEAGGMKTTAAVYQRGVAFLLRTQFEDGSWWVRSRSWPFQPHFNGKFPHGKDQWISQGGTAWAAIALLLTLDPVKNAPAVPMAEQLIARYQQSPAAQRRKAEAVSATTNPATAIDFVRDIRPIFERSCAGCHGGEKPRAQFTLASRDSLLKGGQSGEPAIAPGYSDDSLLIQYVSGKIEDLEMPPLDRREKYPALNETEIERLRVWIDAGAPWSAATPAKVSATAP
jgi:ankyrin repeat protein/mono/diheme cytochrome c family protein